MVEVSHLLAKMKIFQKQRSSLTRFQRVLIVIDPQTLRRQVLPSLSSRKALRSVLFALCASGFFFAIHQILSGRSVSPPVGGVCHAHH